MKFITCFYISFKQKSCLLFYILFYHKLLNKGKDKNEPKN